MLSVQDFRLSYYKMPTANSMFQDCMSITHSLYPIRLLQDQLNVTNNLRLEVEVAVHTPHQTARLQKSRPKPPAVLVVDEGAALIRTGPLRCEANTFTGRPRLRLRLTREPSNCSTAPRRALRWPGHVRLYSKGGRGGVRHHQPAKN